MSEGRDCLPWEAHAMLFSGFRRLRVLTMYFYPTTFVDKWLRRLANSCLVSTFFVYSFFHLFLTIGLIVWEVLTAGWIQLGLILLSDVLLIICLFGVKYLMEAIRTGNIYSRPGEIYDKY